MIVAKYYNNSDIRLEELPTPKIGPGEILVRVRASGICGTDVMEWYRIQKAPRILGHEIAGEIAAIGPNCAPGLEIGDLVAVGSASCGRCHWCMTGQDRACARHYAGAPRYGDAWGPGGFADF